MALFQATFVPFEDTFKTHSHSGENSNKCKMCGGFIPSHLGAVPPRSGAAVRITRQQLKGIGRFKIVLVNEVHFGVASDGSGI